jgi:Arf-GAP/coiled-coil/ANK repeat/PH domain-containing protein
VPNVAHKSTQQQESLADIVALEGNQICADCAATSPEWASINLGILLCIECSGIHRSLGVQVSKVRSLTLDKWDPESIVAMLALGNSRVNQIYEARYVELARAGDVAPRPQAKTDRHGKEAFIADKYVNRLFVLKSQKSIEQLNSDLWGACRDGDFVGILTCIAQGANVDWKNGEANGKTAFLDAIENDNADLTSFLLQWNCDIDATDADGSNALHYVVKARNIRLLTSLLRRRANSEARNIQGQLPIDLALSMADPELVTQLRLHQFEMQELAQARSDAAARAAMAETPPELPDKSLPAQPRLDKSPTKSPRTPTLTVPYSASRTRTDSFGNQSESSSIASPDNNYQKVSAALANAGAYAGRFFKTGFSKVQSEIPNDHPHSAQVSPTRSPDAVPQPRPLSDNHVLIHSGSTLEDDS